MNFDLIAGAYWWLERIAFGRALESSRTSLLPFLTPAPRKALFIGEGDGRFLTEFLKIFPEAEVDVVEASTRMIAGARRRLMREFPLASVRFLHGQILSDPVLARGYDLVVTHFFLDVLTEAQLATLIGRMSSAASGGQSLLTEFRVCDSSLVARFASGSMIRVMYAFFRAVAGLHVSAIPDFDAAFRRAGMKLCRRNRHLRSFVTSEIWRLP